MRHICTLGAGLLGSIVLTVTGGATAGANPISTGCPTGHPLTSVADLAATGHRAPAVIDGAGNDDGYVCARSLPDAVCRTLPLCTVSELYLFTDNDLPQGHDH